jgi:hypothetical protein
MVPAVKLYWITRSAIGAMSTATILSVYMAQNFGESKVTSWAVNSNRILKWEVGMEGNMHCRSARWLVHASTRYPSVEPWTSHLVEVKTIYSWQEERFSK